MKVDSAEPFNVPVDPIALGIPVSVFVHRFFHFKSLGHSGRRDTGLGSFISFGVVSARPPNVFCGVVLITSV
jgi:hypothetical protein